MDSNMIERCLLVIIFAMLIPTLVAYGLENDIPRLILELINSVLL